MDGLEGFRVFDLCRFTLRLGVELLRFLVLWKPSSHGFGSFQSECTSSGPFVGGSVQTSFPCTGQESSEDRGEKGSGAAGRGLQSPIEPPGGRQGWQNT